MGIKSEKEYMLEYLEKKLEVNNLNDNTDYSDIKRGLKVEFANYDKKIKKDQGIPTRIYDIEKITFEVLKERIKQGIEPIELCEVGETIIRKMALEVLKLAPYMSEEEIKKVLIFNRGSMQIQSSKNPLLEHRAIRRAEKNANKTGFSIPNMKSITIDEFRQLTFGIWNKDQINVVKDKLYAISEQKRKGLTDEEMEKIFQECQSKRIKEGYRLHDVEIEVGDGSYQKARILESFIKESLESVTKEELEKFEEKENQNEKVEDEKFNAEI